MIAVMERLRALEAVREADRNAMLNELYQRLMAEEIEDPETRKKVEAHVYVAEVHGWRPRRGGKWPLQ
jgi:hypothetical protein